MTARLTLLFILASGFLLANARFDKGYKAAMEKNYTEAIVHFEELLAEEPTNFSALFNLGNCYFAEKNMGKAILNFEKAHKIHPADEDVNTALTNAYVALGKADTWESPYTFADSTFYRVGSFWWSLLAFLFSMIAALLILVLFIDFKRLRIPMRIPLLLVSLGLMTFFVYAGSRAVFYMEDERFAIVTAEKIPILKNEFGEMSDRYLNIGERVEILEEKESYLLVQTSTGEQVLILSTDIERISSI
jgi:tetratricopeptide (TPR) repeat protein